jgi:Holliday junction resolvase RusA-like endonuclease
MLEVGPKQLDALWKVEVHGVDPLVAVTTVVVYGMPGAQGSKRFVGLAKKTGRGILIESSKKVAPWRQDVKAAAELVRNGAAPIDGNLVLKMTFTLPKPKSAPKRRRTYPNVYPDVSKLARSTEDALVQAGLIRDDARIVGYDKLWKAYPNEDVDALEAPGVKIEIRTITEAS